MIKAVVYKLSIDSKITEHNINVTYRLLWNEMKDATTPATKAVLQAPLADKINKLYTQIYGKPKQENGPGNKDSDITSWSNEQLVAANRQSLRGVTFRKAYYVTLISQPMQA